MRRVWGFVWVGALEVVVEVSGTSTGALFGGICEFGDGVRYVDEVGAVVLKCALFKVGLHD